MTRCTACAAVLAAVVAGATAHADTIPVAAMQSAHEIYASRCVTCHGPRGKGDGPAGVALSPRPQDLSDPAWQRSVSDEEIETIIRKGGPAVGKSPLMPANPDLQNKPEVIHALRAVVRGLAASAAAPAPTAGKHP